MKTETRTTAGMYTRALTRVPVEQWPAEMASHMTLLPLEVWRSRDFLLQVYREGNGYERLSVIRTQLNGSGRWADGIPWEDLQRLKRECGRGDRWAVEVFPADDRVVNVANMRHLFVLQEPPPYGWHEQSR